MIVLVRIAVSSISCRYAGTPFSSVMLSTGEISSKKVSRFIALALRLTHRTYTVLESGRESIALHNAMKPAVIRPHPTTVRTHTIRSITIQVVSIV